MDTMGSSLWVQVLGAYNNWTKANTFSLEQNKVVEKGPCSDKENNVQDNDGDTQGMCSPMKAGKG